MIHIFEGLNVWHQVMMPAQRGIVVGLAHDVGDLLVGLGRHLVDELAGQLAGSVELLCHLGGALRHGFKDLGPI